MAFEADLEMNDTLNLLLVAKRVAEWLSPLVYKVVVIHTDRTWPPGGLPPDRLPRYGQYVRHLLLRVTPNISDSAVESYFKHCSNLINLALWVPYSDPRSDIPFTEYLSDLPHLKELSVNIDLLAATPSKSLSQVLSRVTHLDVATDLNTWEDCEPLLHFPSLTHLSVFDDVTLDLIPIILEHIPSIEVLILWEGVEDSFTIVEGYGEYPPNEPRVAHLLCGFIQGWEIGARGIQSPWIFAEDVLERRRRERDAEESAERNYSEESS
ncbi:hypothetical protein BDN72DRAFT_134971 [Pluteus cervinus]|uniref:Uncharacterized protein n=1 Tax=Pluteus cervinus TaxID=181527 RepID=A0ACD3BA07_9AGAR|nr:hypothetical protein BDN72DRAFT_134971 [Pluteus cervinus]